MTNLYQRASDKTEKVTLAPLALNKTTEQLPISAQSKIDLDKTNSIDISSIYGDGLVCINKDGKISFINKIACKLTGWTQNEATNQPIEKIFLLDKNSTTPINKNLISNVIESAQLIAPDTEQEIKTKDNNKLTIHFSVSPCDRNSAILMFQQINKNPLQKNRSLLFQASYDPLTRIFNRNVLQKEINKIHAEAKKNNATYSILLLNLDRFKLVNDRYGQTLGDKLLQLLAERMQFFLRDNDIIGRWAGEEFICVLPETDVLSASDIAERLRQNICEHAFLLNSYNIFTSASIGIANYPSDAKNPEDLFCTADATLYEAKIKGRNRVDRKSVV